MPKPMSEQRPEVKLLTLINVNQARPAKRKRASARDWHSEAKKAAKTTLASPPTATVTEIVELGAELAAAEEVDEEDAAAEELAKMDSYERHWAPDSKLVEGKSKEELEAIKWKKAGRKVVSGLGAVSELIVEGNEAVAEEEATSIYNPKLLEKLKAREDSGVTATQQALLRTLASYRDICYPKVELTQHDDMRAAIALHAMNHVLKTRARVLKNNDHLAKLAADPKSTAAPRNTADQGFTRPKVLILLPFRNSALTWVNLLTSLSLADQVENKARFDSEFSLPEGAVDKLIENPGNYTKDHIETFKGNIDDSFRLGMKVTRKSIKLFSEFYSCDIIVASPLGLRTSIEKEKGDSDFLSSIELLIVDQMDVMLMQNWDHLQFVLERLNKLPEEAHGCDFSRVKPWYLDGKAAYLRQSVLLSAYETPEIRSFYSKSLVNVAGKIKADLNYDGVLANVPSGIKQVFSRFDAADLYAEDDARFEQFTTKTLPMLLKSAVSSSQTIIFVPSYFDFVRLKRYLKKLADFSFASISEYSSTPDVSRARGAFYAGRVSFLLITERFHFFRRYRIRGAKTFVFYAPPDHADYYPEILSFPFNLKEGGDGEPDVDESELSCQVLFSKFDLLRLERICGSEDARKMVTSGADATRFTFL
ncbi:U3 small nucleolar RNA-associated protein 25, partial [Phenoliferia sp. Uapishka_3]